MKTSKKGIAGKMLTALLVIFIISWLGLLSSCVAYVRTPRHHRSTIIIEGHETGNLRNSTNIDISSFC